MHKFFLLSLLVVFFSCSTGKKYNQSFLTAKRDSLITDERATLKKYAFCKCLANKYPADSSINNDGSLQGYIETGSYGNKAYEAVDSFLVKKCAGKYNSKYKHNLYLMQCMDIYNSAELDSLVKTLDGNLNLDTL